MSSSIGSNIGSLEYGAGCTGTTKELQDVYNKLYKLSKLKFDVFLEDIVNIIKKFSDTVLKDCSLGTTRKWFSFKNTTKQRTKCTDHQLYYKIKKILMWTDKRFYASTTGVGGKKVYLLIDNLSSKDGFIYDALYGTTNLSTLHEKFKKQLKDELVEKKHVIGDFEPFFVIRDDARISKKQAIINEKYKGDRLKMLSMSAEDYQTGSFRFAPIVELNELAKKLSTCTNDNINQEFQNISNLLGSGDDNNNKFLTYKYLSDAVHLTPYYSTYTKFIDNFLTHIKNIAINLGYDLNPEGTTNPLQIEEVEEPVNQEENANAKAKANANAKLKAAKAAENAKKRLESAKPPTNEGANQEARLQKEKEANQEARLQKEKEARLQKEKEAKEEANALKAKENSEQERLKAESGKSAANTNAQAAKIAQLVLEQIFTKLPQLQPTPTATVFDPTDEKKWYKILLQKIKDVKNMINFDDKDMTDIKKYFEETGNETVDKSSLIKIVNEIIEIYTKDLDKKQNKIDIKITSLPEKENKEYDTKKLKFLIDKLKDEFENIQLFIDYKIEGIQKNKTAVTDEDIKKLERYFDIKTKLVSIFEYNNIIRTSGILLGGGKYTKTKKIKKTKSKHRHSNRTSKTKGAKLTRRRR